MTTAASKISQLENLCVVWNKQTPIGTPVDYWRRAGSFETPIATITTSEAWVMGGHTIMVMIDAMSGAVPVSHVKRREVAA